MPSAPVTLAPSSPTPLCTTAAENSEAATLSVVPIALAVACLTHAYSPATREGTAVVHPLSVPFETAPVANV